MTKTLKAILCSILAIMMLLSLSACDNKDGNNQNVNGQNDVKVRAKNTAEAFLDAYKNNSAENIKAMLYDPNAIGTLNLSSRADALDGIMKVIPDYLDKSEIEKALNEKINNAVSYKITEVTEENDVFTVNFTLAQPNLALSEALADEFEAALTEEKIDEIVKKVKASTQAPADSLLEEEIIRIAAPEITEIFIDVINNFDIETNETTKTLKVIKKDGKFLIDITKTFQ